MSFLGIGYQEVLLILVLMLVVVGPERLPGVAYQIGKAVREMQKYARAVRNEFGDELTYVEEQYKVVKGEVESTRRSFREQQTQFQAELREATGPIAEAQAALAEALPSNLVSITGPPAPDTTVSDGAGTPPAAEPAAAPPAPSAPTPPLVF